MTRASTANGPVPVARTGFSSTLDDVAAVGDQPGYRDDEVCDCLDVDGLASSPAGEQGRHSQTVQHRHRGVV
jgi:hypothetical protein